MKFLADEKMISRLQFAGSIGIVIAVVAGLGTYFIHQQQVEYEENAQAQANQYLIQQQAILIDRVNATKDYLSYMRSRTEWVLKAKVQEEVDQVLTIAESIYRQESPRHSTAELKKMIVETIRPLRFGEGRSYVFIHQLDGTCILLPTDPELEGKNVAGQTDDLGRQLQPDLLAAAQRPTGEGFIHYRWKMLDQSGFGEKIGYVRLFKPYGWAIGTGEYLQVVEKDLQGDALERLRANQFVQAGYLAVIADDGHLLVMPSAPVWEGSLISDLPPKQAEIGRQIVKKGRDGGGFIQYDWNRPGDSRQLPKLSYVSRMNDWGWTLVAGVYLDDINAVTDAGREMLSRSVKTKAHLTLLVLGLGLGASILIRWGLANLLKRLIQRYETNIEARNAELKEANRQFFLVNFMVDNSADLIFLIDQESRLVYANHFVHERLGWDKDHVIAGPLKDVTEHIAGEDSEGGEYRRLEVNVQARDGRTLPLEVGVKELVYDGNRYHFAIARDITERHRWEADLKRSNAELEAFAYVASHDLRQPLRAVSSFLSLLERRLEGRLDGDAREFLAFARDGAKRMDRLILDLLEYSRVGRIGKPPGPVDLEHVMRALAPMLALAFSDADGTLTVENELPMVWGNGDELTRLFQNLIGNAVKYRAPSRPLAVSLSCRKEDGHWLFAVTDNGIGILPESHERIFGLFQRLHDSNKYEGTGIGLAICRKIVDRHGGRIWVQSRPDDGSCFLFTLPLMPVAVDGYPVEADA